MQKRDSPTISSFQDKSELYETQHTFCRSVLVITTFPLTFRLKDTTYVTVSIVSRDSYDFDIVLTNGRRRRFRWHMASPHTLLNRQGNIDEMMKETVEIFLNKIASR